MGSKKESQERKAEEAWQGLIKKYQISERMAVYGQCDVSAEQMKEFREPRLMAKWDSEEVLPAALKDRKWNILPVSRGSYTLSDFKLYEKLPDFSPGKEPMEEMHFAASYESIDFRQITSEANAIHVLLLSDALDRFLGAEGTVETFNGRMGTGDFHFSVDSFSGNRRKVSVTSAQCEIDGGFENDENVIIMEAKNVLHPDFHVRQLYYPYRLWRSRVRKPIRLIFSQYYNRVFRLLEYGFTDAENYSSIRLLREQCYSLDDTKITKDDLIGRWERTQAVYSDDCRLSGAVPFPQADTFGRVISLLEQLGKGGMTGNEIASLMQFRERQSDYYFNAGKYLGLFEKVSTWRGKVIGLTKLGEELNRMTYKERQLKLVELLLSHKIFHRLFGKMLDRGAPISKEEIKEDMLRLSVCSDKVADRRAGTVQSWLAWAWDLQE